MMGLRKKAADLGTAQIRATKLRPTELRLEYESARMESGSFSATLRGALTNG